MNASAAHLTPVPDEPVASGPASLEEEAQRYAHLAEQHSRIGAELERIKARFRDELPIGSNDLAGLKIGIAQPSMFSAARAAQLLTAEQLTSITEISTWVSPDLAAKILTPEQLASISETSKTISAALAKSKLAPELYR
jgi:hypothetical protein